MFLDFLFPPLCLHCKKRTEIPFFCRVCWEMAHPLDPMQRCPHCFEEKEDLCERCAHKPKLPFERASVFEDTPVTRYLILQEGEKAEGIAGFLFYQWIQLDWPTPDLIVPVPGIEHAAEAFSHFLDIPFANLLSKKMGEWMCDLEDLLEEKTVLLLDLDSPLITLEEISLCIQETFPKRIFQLSLLHHDDRFYS